MMERKESELTVAQAVAIVAIHSMPFQNWSQLTFLKHFGFIHSNEEAEKGDGQKSFHGCSSRKDDVWTPSDPSNYIAKRILVAVSYTHLTLPTKA